MKLSRKLTILIDLITSLLCVGPIVLSILSTLRILEEVSTLTVKIVLFPFVLQLSFVFMIFVFRVLLPRLKPGVYPMSFNWGFLAWYLHSMLTRSARCFGIHYLLHSTSTMRWLYWRALGAKVAFNMNTSYKITIHDAPVIQIGAGTTLAEDVEVSGHLVRGDKILIAAVTIGNGVFVGRNTYIGPRTRIADKAWIGMGNELGGNVIAENERIESFAKARGSKTST